MYARMDSYYRKSEYKKTYDVGIYLRLSREDENTVQSESITNQKEYLTRYVLEQEWNLVDIYVDDGYTGTNFDRPDFKRMVKDIENKRINLVITKDLSRLGRDYIDTGYYIERFFPKFDVRYIALNDGIDTFESNNNNDMSPFKSVINDMYAKDISKKVRTTMNSKRQKGEFIGAFAPYGYLKDPNNKNKLIIEPITSEIVRKIFDMYINSSGYAHIAHVLNDENIITPNEHKRKNTNYFNPNAKAGLWTQETVRRIITNPTYAGNLTQNRYTKINYKVKKLKSIPKDFWITVEDTHEAIIDKSIFELAQQIASKKPIYPTGETNTHLLTGLIFCKDCGERMTYTKTQKGEVYCICSKYKRFKLCSRHSYLEKELENQILEDLKQVSQHAINKDKLYKLAQQKSNQTSNTKPDKEINEINLRISEIKKDIKLLYQDKLKGILSEQDFIDLSQDFNKEREQLLNKLSMLNKRNEESKQGEIQSEKLLILINNLIEFNNVTNTILLKLIDRIEISEDKKITIHYKFRNPL